MGGTIPAAQTLRINRISVERFPLGRHLANAYLVYAEGEDCAAVIDPGADSCLLLERAAEIGATISSILLTHAHWDHVGAASDLTKHSGAPVWIHPKDMPLLKASPFYAFRIDQIRIVVPANISTIEHGQTVPLGASFAFSVQHTPGHSEGGVTYRIGSFLFTGDTLMPDEEGRSDLPGGDSGALLRSLRSLSQELASDDVVCPGHGEFWPASQAAEWLGKRLTTPG